MTLVEELRWRGMIHDVMPGTEEMLEKELVTGYIGFDPTADSLHIGHLVGVMLLKHLQSAGHKPIALVGGATGMIGDPSGKSEERNLLDESTLRYNQECMKKQLAKFLEFETGKENEALMVNNYDWMQEFSFLDFIRDVGKHITVNYMLAKDSVKKRLDTGMSFTEFTYQLVQGYDYLHLYRTYGCRLQMGGSDQWGNIVTGTELIRRKEGGEAFALTCPLITKSDGGKFGKTEQGNIWLDPEKSSPYAFYQFWLNVGDEDAEKYIRIFTMLSIEEISQLIEEHRKQPHLRTLQKRLAREITAMVHSNAELETAMEASEILFGRGTTDMLKKLDSKTILGVFEGVPRYELNIDDIKKGTNIIDLLAEKTDIMTSRAEVRRNIKGGGLQINKLKIESEDLIIKTTDLLKDKYLLVQKGKKNYFLIIFK